MDTEADDENFFIEIWDEFDDSDNVMEDAEPYFSRQPADDWDYEFS